MCPDCLKPVGNPDCETCAGEPVAGETLAQARERLVPIVVISVDGGIAEEWTSVEGTGKPEVHILDWDRDGNDPDDTREFLDYATSVAAILTARGEDASGLLDEIDRCQARFLDD